MAGYRLDPTPAQPGAANDTAAHTGPPDVWGGSGAVPDPRRTPELPAPPEQQPADRRSFRPIQTAAAVDAGRPGELTPSDGDDTKRTTGGAGHAVPGSWAGSNAVPDPRRVFDGPDATRAGAPYPDAANVPVVGERIGNYRDSTPADELDTASLRPRAGSTGSDEARPSRMPRWLFLRPFDKGVADRLGAGLEKVPFAAPTASTPPTFTDDVPGAIPSPGGGVMAPGMGAAGIQPNSFRLLPGAWDAQLINTGGLLPNATAAETGRRSAGWRGRSS